MKTFEDKLASDTLVFGKNITNCVYLSSWNKRIWGAWKVLTGEAGIVITRINPRDIFKKDQPCPRP